MAVVVFLGGGEARGSITRGEAYLGDFLNELPPLAGAELTGDFEKSEPLRQSKIAFPRLNCMLNLRISVGWNTLTEEELQFLK